MRFDLLLYGVFCVFTWPFKLMFNLFFFLFENNEKIMEVNRPNGEKSKSNKIITIWTKESILEKIDNLSGKEFEYFIMKLLNVLEFENVSNTKISSDYGVDLVATKNNETYAIQCKRHKNRIGIEAVQQIVAGKTYYKCTNAIVITNNYFTKNAIELAKINNVKLWDRRKLELLIENYFV